MPKYDFSINSDQSLNSIRNDGMNKHWIFTIFFCYPYVSNGQYFLVSVKMYGMQHSENKLRLTHNMKCWGRHKNRLFIFDFGLCNIVYMLFGLWSLVCTGCWLTVFGCYCGHWYSYIHSHNNLQHMYFQFSTDKNEKKNFE